MAGRLFRAKATVDADGRELAGVSISVRNDTATVRLGQDVLIEQGGVARVIPNGRRTWTLEFSDPALGPWTVTDEARKCCGRR